MDIYSLSYGHLKFKGFSHTATRQVRIVGATRSCRLAAVVAAAAAKTLAATMAAAFTVLAAIQWYHAALYISSCVGRGWGNHNCVCIIRAL